MTMYPRHIGNRIGTYQPRSEAMRSHTIPTARGGPLAQMPKERAHPHQRLLSWFAKSIAYHGEPGA